MKTLNVQTFGEEIRTAAHALVGASDAIAEQVRDLAARSRKQARRELEELSERGRAVTARVRVAVKPERLRRAARSAGEELREAVNDVRAGKPREALERVRDTVDFSASVVGDRAEGVAKATRQAVTEVDEMSDLSRRELYELASEKDIPGRSKMSKEELLEALTEAS